MKEYAKKTDQDLRKLLAQARAELRGIRFDISGTKVKDVKLVNAKKKEIARILTELRARELAG